MELLSKSPYCCQNCILKSQRSPTTLLFSPPKQNSDLVLPAEYHDFLEVFSKRVAQLLPLHQSYDCPIELLPGAEIPFEPIFPLSEPELESPTRIHRWKSQVGIQPSVHIPGWCQHIFHRKDHSLKPCVDYWELNKITVKNGHPLLLVLELIQRLSSARMFIKLDLRGPYNLVPI